MLTNETKFYLWFLLIALGKLFKLEMLVEPPQAEGGGRR